MICRIRPELRIGWQPEASGSRAGSKLLLNIKLQQARFIGINELEGRRDFIFEGIVGYQLCAFHTFIELVFEAVVVAFVSAQRYPGRFIQYAGLIKMLMKGIEKVNPVEAAEIERGKIGIDEMCILYLVFALYFIGQVDQRFPFFHAIEMSAREAGADAADLAHTGTDVQDFIVRLVSKKPGGFHSNSYRGEVPGRMFLVLAGIDGIELLIARVFFLLEEFKDHPQM